MANFEDVKTNKVDAQEVIINDVHYKLYFLLNNKNDIKKVSFINDENVRFEFSVKNGTRKEGQDVVEFLTNIVDNLSDKLLTPEELEFKKPLSEYMYFSKLPNGEVIIGGLKKEGAKIMQVISDNPFLLDRIESYELRKLILDESVKLMHQREDLDKLSSYKGQDFYCDYVFNANNALSGFKITYERNNRTIEKEYKLDIYKLKNALFVIYKMK